MRKILFCFFFLTYSTLLFSQTDIQEHYDFGKNRKYLTTTLEMFKADEWGNTYFFVDFDYDNGENNHTSCSYMEISRTLNLGDSPFGMQAEYDGGVGNSDGFGYSIRNAFLFGGNYNIHNKDFSINFTLQLLYKYIQGNDSFDSENSAQITAVWNVNFLNAKFSFDGFADTWMEDNKYGNNSIVFLTEPQIWYAFNNHLSAGSEIEISKNLYSDNFRVNPTLAMKWIF